MTSLPPLPPSRDDRRDGMGPTRLLDLAILVVLFGVGIWLLFHYNFGSIPPMPWAAGLVLYLLAAIEAVSGFVIRRRIAEREIGPAPGQLHPIATARAVALAKASAILGAIFTGAWAGMLIFLLQQQDLAAADQDKPAAVIGLVGAILLTVAALWLEYCCRAPDDPTEEPAGLADPDAA